MSNYTIGCYTVTHNPNKDWLKEALDSTKGLFDQYVLVDDGSDEPVEVADFRFDENVGCPAARNKAISMLNTDWIAMLDDDDVFYPETVKALREILPELDADIVSSPVQFFGDADLLWATDPKMENILRVNQIPAGSWFKRNVWERLKFNDIKTEDWDFWIRAYLSKSKFAHIDKPLYKSRVHKGSRSSSLKCFGDLIK
jgi:glycosyltransferase involved in cell wall biosynthesis